MVRWSIRAAEYTRRWCSLPPSGALPLAGARSHRMESPPLEASTSLPFQHFSFSGFQHFPPMHLPHVRLVTALALAALFVGCETVAPEKIDLQPVNNAPRLRAPASAPLTTMPVPRVQTTPQYPLSLRR